MNKNKILKTTFITPVLCLTMGALTSCINKKADLVVYSNIYTAESENNSEAKAFAVKDGKYIYVGDKEGVKKYIKEGKTQIIENEGLVIPGCTEGHAHYFDGTGQSNQLIGCNQSYDEVLVTLENEFKNNNIKQFVSFGNKNICGRTPRTKMCYQNYYEYLKKLGHTPHDTRHTFITRARECGMDALILQRIVGHTSKTITEKVYTHISNDELLKEISKINYEKQ